MSFLKELWAYMRSRRKYVLLPIMLIMALFGVLIVLSKGSVIAPFIYTIF
jgi:predicted nucleic acid-binding Zn ribbon protein